VILGTSPTQGAWRVPTGRNLAFKEANTLSETAINLRHLTFNSVERFNAFVNGYEHFVHNGQHFGISHHRL
jgi:hypothetical protein